MKKAVVTGGAGFIGSHIVDYLLAREVEVLVVDNFSTGNKGNLKSAQKKYPEQIEVFEADICSPIIQQKICAFCADVVFHYAAQVSVNKSVHDPMWDAAQNILGTINVLEACVSSKIKTFIMASSAAIYGDQKIFPADEEHTLHPNSPYGVSKKTCESYLDYYARAKGMNTIALRYANVYGPRQNAKGESGVIAIYCDRLQQQTNFTVNGDGAQTRDFVYVEDVAAINFILAQNPPQKFSYFNVGHGKQLAINDLIFMLQQCEKKYGLSSISILHGPSLPGELRQSALDANKIKKQIKWSPQISIEDGLDKTFASLNNLE